MKTKTTRNTLGLLGATLLGGMVLGNTAFAVEPLSQGYQLAAAKTPGEGKCGEGKCGDASFARTDTNHDGKVSREEFLVVAKDRAADFDKIDSNHDGFISEQEAANHLAAIYKANGKAMPDGLFSHLTGNS